MRNVLVVNQNISEGKAWREMLRKNGLAVLPECEGLSGMVHLLAREKVHIVLCAADLVNAEVIPVIKASVSFFPRIKVIIVGEVPKVRALAGITRVVLTKSIDTAVKACGEASPPSGSAPSSEKNGERSLRHLLGDHFITNEEAAMLFARSFQWTPGYAVLRVCADSYRGEVLRTLKKAAAELKLAYVLPCDADDFYIFLDKSPGKEHTLMVANDVRHRLFR